MEQKKINLTLLLSSILFAIGVAVNSLADFFYGFGIVFVGIVVLSALIFAIGFRNKENRRRLYDIFTLVVISIIFGTILYCSWEWALKKSASLVDFKNIFCNFYSIVSLFFLIYGIVRYFAEVTGTKLTAVEVILGFEQIEHKPRVKKEKAPKQPKQPKEVVKGDLEQKPLATSEKSEQSIVETKQEEAEIKEETTEIR